MDLMFLGNRLKKVTSSIGDKLSNLDEEKQNKFIYSATEPVSSENGDIWFDLTEYIALTINHGLNGICEPSGVISVKRADSLDIKFTPNEGYEIDKVLANGVDITKYILIDGTGVGTYSFKDIEADTTIFATYKKKTVNYDFPEEGLKVNQIDGIYPYGSNLVTTKDENNYKYFIPFEDGTAYAALDLGSDHNFMTTSNFLEGDTIDFTFSWAAVAKDTSSWNNIIYLNSAEAQDIIKDQYLCITLDANNQFSEDATLEFSLTSYSGNNGETLNLSISDDSELHKILNNGPLATDPLIKSITIKRKQLKLES